MSHQPWRGGGAPHRNQEIGDASPDSAALRPENLTEDSLDDSDPGRIGTLSVPAEAAAPACPAPHGLLGKQAGGDGAARSCGLVRPGSALHVTPAERAVARALPGDPPAVGDRVCVSQAVASAHDRDVRERGWDRQAHRRRHEEELRKRSVAFVREMRAGDWSTAETAQALGLSPRTVRRWDHGWQTDRLAPRRRGRPPRIASGERRAEVTGFLKAHGPSISIAVFQAQYPDLARAELTALRADFRAEWQREHPREQCRLEWLDPGSVWAMDFSHSPHRVDGVFPAILNVRDLASHQQLLWLAVEHENAATVVDALVDLFAVHGAPLVMKCDNGPAFRAHVTKRFLLNQEVFMLYSPPYCARYNGACERANRTLKELTEHIADQAGRPGFRTSDDLLQARLRANRLSRPWGAHGATPEETWMARGVLSLDKRENMWQHLKSGIATVLEQHEIDPTVALSHYTQAEIERIAAHPVLEQLGLLHVTRRPIAPAF